MTRFWVLTSLQVGQATAMQAYCRPYQLEVA